MAVRAARLGFKIAHVDIPTVYGDEQSHLSPTRDVPRIVGMMLRLTFEPAPEPRAPSVREADARSERRA